MFDGTLGDSSSGDNVWETSSAREWLNGTYLTSLSTLQSHAVQTSITTRSEYNADTWITTQDKVFLLSEADLFGTHKSTATSEAKDYTYGTSQLVTDVNMRKCSNTISAHYWLRSPRIGTAGVALCNASSGGPNGGNYYIVRFGVRPALWVNLAG